MADATKPPRPLTAKQQAFVLYYNSHDCTATEAYRAVYDCRTMSPATVHREAHGLTRHVGVAPLLTDRRELVAANPERPPAALDRRGLTAKDASKEWLIVEAMMTYSAASRAGQHSAAKQALELAAKLGGHLVERRDVRVVRTIEDLTDEELEALSKTVIDHEDD